MIDQHYEQRLSLCEGKYEIMKLPDGRMRAFRYGNPWRDLTGDHLIAALMEAALSAQPRQDELSVPPFGPLFSAVVRARTVEEEVEACRALARAVNADLDKCLNGDAAMKATGGES